MMIMIFGIYGRFLYFEVKINAEGDEQNKHDFWKKNCVIVCNLNGLFILCRVRFYRVPDDVGSVYKSFLFFFAQ